MVEQMARAGPSSCGRAPCHYAWVVAAVVFTSLLMAGGIRSTPGVLTVSFEREFGWSRALISGAVSVNILEYGLVGPFAAAVMEAAGVRKSLCAALALLAVGSGLTVLMLEPWHLYALWGVLVGLAAGVIAPTLGKVVTNRWFVARGGLVMGLFSAGASAGQVVLAPLLGYLVETHGWRAASLAMAGIAAGLVPLVAVLMVDTPQDIRQAAYGAVPTGDDAPPPSTPAEGDAEVAAVAAMPAEDAPDCGAGGGGGVESEAPTPGSEPPGDAVTAVVGPGASIVRIAASTAPPRGGSSGWDALRTPLRHLRYAAGLPDFWLLAGSFFVCGASTNGLIATHIVPACQDHGMTETAAAGFLAAIGVFDIVGTLASGWLTDRFDPRKLLCCYYALRGVALVLLPWAFSVEAAGLWPFAVVYGLDWVATVPPTAQLCTHCFGRERSAVLFGWCLAAHQVGAAAAAAGAGAVRTTSGTYNSAFWFSGGLCTLTALAVLAIGRVGGGGSGFGAVGAKK